MLEHRITKALIRKHTSVIGSPYPMYNIHLRDITFLLPSQKKAIDWLLVDGKRYGNLIPTTKKSFIEAVHHYFQDKLNADINLRNSMTINEYIKYMDLENEN